MSSHLRDRGPPADSLGKGRPTSIVLVDGPWPRGHCGHRAGLRGERQPLVQWLEKTARGGTWGTLQAGNKCLPEAKAVPVGTLVPGDMSHLPWVPTQRSLRCAVCPALPVAPWAGVVIPHGGYVPSKFVMLPHLSA